MNIINLFGKNTKVIPGLLVCLILLAGIFFRFYNLDKKVFWNDEIVTVRILGGYTDSQLAKYYHEEMVSAEYFKSLFHSSDNFSIKEMIHVMIHDGYIQNTPFYYVMLKEWIKIFGDSIWTIRLFSAVISLFVFPLLYWLCMELFSSRRVAVIAMVLLAVSPFHVLYAQEARPYSLVTVFILFSSATLLRALRINTPAGWLVYMVSLVLGLYTHFLFVLVAISHGLYVFIVNRCKFNSSLIRYLIVALISLICFSPWVHMVIANTNFTQFSSYTMFKISRQALVHEWGANIRRTFIDSNLICENSMFYVFPMMCLLGYWIFYFFTNIKVYTSHLFILILLAVTAGTLMEYDLIFKEIHSYVPRYLLPGVLGIEIITAYFFADKLDSLSFFARNTWRVIFIFIVAGGLISCFISSQTEMWWNKRSVDIVTPSFAKIIDNSRSPLIILPRKIWLGNVISLALKLNPADHFCRTNQSDLFNNPYNFTEIYLIEPSNNFLYYIDKQDYKLTRIFPENYRLENFILYKLVKR